MVGTAAYFSSPLLAGVIAIALYILSRRIRPKPLPGIPYNHDAAGKLFGDIPEMMGYVLRTKRIFCWLTSLTTRHQSPIVQAFIKPGSLPWVVVTVPMESQDILLRRSKEFDWSGFFGELIFSAVLTLAQSVTDTQLSPAPRLTSWVLRKFPYMRRATAIKDQYIRDQTEQCVRSIKEGDHKLRSALHSVLLREKDMAEKEGREPNYYKRAIADEFFGFMLAGHDTTATTVAWGVKLLSDNPLSQGHLRNTLRDAFPEALQEIRAPSYAELTKTSIPYLDAVVEEILRHANTIAFVARQALQDTVVLGRNIPKGTDVFLMGNGAGYLEPNMPVQDSDRSPGARRSETKALTGHWDDSSISRSQPERWLKPLPEDGIEAFDPMAGPSIPFGLGPRGCFGKRLALQALKIQFALVVWHFRLLKCPKKLSGYEAVQKFAREPVQCFVRLERVEL